MSDSSISQKFNMPIATPQFRSSNTNPINPTTKENKGLSTGAKVAIGSGLVALASYGIYLATRGKVKPKTTPPATTNNPVQEIKELAVNTFKEAGNKFVKGKAVMADGTNYTGKIVSEGKDGSKVVMEYLDGVLQKSTKTKGTETIFEKTYKYSDDLGLVNVTKNGNSTFSKTYDKLAKQILINDGKLRIDTETGIIIENNTTYIDKVTGMRGNVESLKVNYSLEGGAPDYTMKFNGRELPKDYNSTYSASLKPNEACVHQRVTAIPCQSNNSTDLRVGTDYRYNSTGKYNKRYREIKGSYGQYEDLSYNYTDGIIKNNKEVLFRYNPRTKEISELTIDKDLAQQIIENGEKQFKFLKKVTRAWQNRQNSIL